MKKFFLSLFIGGLVLVTGSVSFVSAKFVQVTIDKDTYCATSTICGTASKPIALMMDFINEMINSIHTQGTEGEYLGQYVSPNWFKGNVFAPPTQTIVSKVARNVVQKLKFSMATTAIFSNPVNFGGLKDIAGGTTLLFKNKVFLRDIKLIEELENQLATKKYELGAGGGRYEQINVENLMIMRSILQKYVQQGIFQPGSKINDGALYNNITSMLTSMVSAAKSFLYFGSTSQFDQISRGGLDGVRIVFDSGAMSVMNADYQCARGISNPCDSAIKKFKDNINMLYKSTISSTTGSIKVITDAVERLGEVFSKSSNQSDKFKAREQDLLRSMYGSTRVDSVWMNKPLNYSYDSSNSGGASIFTRSWKKLTTKSVSEKTEKIEKKLTADYIGQDAFVVIMNQYISDVFISQAIDEDISISSEVKDVTPAFAALGKQIQLIKNDILGGKDKDNSLIKNIGEACELQCGRGGSCR